jgi:hypothetical protein
MVQPTKDGARDDPTTTLDSRGNRTLQAKAPMRPIPVVVGSEFIEHLPEVPLIDDDEVVETVGANGPHDPLGKRVRLGRLRRGSHPGNAQSGQPLVKVPTVIRVPIVNEKCRLPTQGRRLDHLAPDPGGRRAGRDAEVTPFSPSSVGAISRFLRNGGADTIYPRSMGSRSASADRGFRVSIVSQEAPRACGSRSPTAHPQPEGVAVVGGRRAAPEPSMRPVIVRAVAAVLTRCSRAARRRRGGARRREPGLNPAGIRSGATVLSRARTAASRMGIA